MFHGIVPVIDAEAGIQRIRYNNRGIAGVRIARKKHWLTAASPWSAARIRTNNVIERINCERRRQTRVVGCFPDGNSALMLVCARLRHVAGTQWGNKKYMNMKHLEAMDNASLAG